MNSWATKARRASKLSQRGAETPFQNLEAVWEGSSEIRALRADIRLLAKSEDTEAAATSWAIYMTTAGYRLDLVRRQLRDAGWTAHADDLSRVSALTRHHLVAYRMADEIRPRQAPKIDKYYDRRANAAMHVKRILKDLRANRHRPAIERQDTQHGDDWPDDTGRLDDEPLF